MHHVKVLAQVVLGALVRAVVLPRVVKAVSAGGGLAICVGGGLQVPLGNVFILYTLMEFPCELPKRYKQTDIFTEKVLI